ncbi:Phytanoyl-CoA dioxygenase (PhyH) [Seminavis robusta]|uniref:Phytanoyl-CoA dioxygenase (PhyH) n=1 Tax=Seminavis robusta TaxID=568900 RepID=A0A9N8ERL2_9STRA|nr:Phytanoyl-CoA dioxygenase (PhyH) [Seminavis robusta]|eukprot:Sro1756_g295610.1 Phytanoyl-CoA dioxygenase (PhyH) (310) ;mRNA; f:6974-7903
MRLVSSCFLLLALPCLSLASEQQQYKRGVEQAGISRVKDFFNTNGYVLLQNFFTHENKLLLKTLRNTTKSVFTNTFQDMYDKGFTQFPEHSRVIFEADDKGANEKKRIYAMQPGRENGFQEIVMRNAGRYEISLQLNPDIFDNDSIDPLLEQLRAVIPSLFDKEMGNMTHVNLASSLIISTAGAGEQKFHADGEHLDMEEHLPVHCLNVFIPLVDVPDEKGPTELYPGSHYVTRQPSPMNIDTNELRKPYAPELKLGDALIFDYRILHRGKPNRSKKHRPMLVLAFSEPWFTDVKNWPQRSLKHTTTKR